MTVDISMVLLREAAEMPVLRIEQELRARYPDLDARISGHDDSTASLKLSNGDLILGDMPVPMPWSELEGPCATSLLWKNAVDDVKSHQRHLIVTLSTSLSAIDRAILLTQATAAVLAAYDAAIGVYWSNGRLLVPKALFVEFAEKILPQGPPLDIWVDFRVGWQTSTTSGGFTTGMEALGHMELEARNWPEKPSELRERFQELARYVLANGPVIKDRDTIGQDATEKIRAVYAPSTFDQQTRVIQLRYESAPAKPWWKVW